MADIAAFRIKRSISVERAAEATRRIDTMSADFPALSASLETVRRDLTSQTERPGAWRFVMLGPRENAIILQLIADEAKRPKVSMKLWGAMLCRLHADTGEIRMTRQEMMDAAGTKTSGNISVALGELRDWGAITRDEESRTIVRWFLNPRIATHLAEHARPWAQRQAPNVLDLAEARKNEATARRARRTPAPAIDSDTPGTIQDKRQRPLIEE